MQNANKMEQSKIVTIGPVFILSDVFLAVAVVIAKAPYSLKIGNLKSYDGNCNESVTLKLNFALSLLRLSHVDHVVQNRRTALSLAWYEWFSCKGKE